MIKENSKCPNCEDVTDLYQDRDGRYLCLHCWAKEKPIDSLEKANGLSHKPFGDFKKTMHGRLGY